MPVFALVSIHPDNSQALGSPATWLQTRLPRECAEGRRQPVTHVPTVALAVTVPSRVNDVDLEYGHECTYDRPFRKRGRPSAANRANTTPAQDSFTSPTSFSVSPRDLPAHPTEDLGSIQLHACDASATPISHAQISPGQDVSNHWVTGQHEVRVDDIVSPSRGLERHSHMHGQPHDNRSQAVTEKYHYQALEDLQPLLNDILDTRLASDLLDLYFTEADGSYFVVSSPFVLCPVIRKQSILRSHQTRPISPALIVTILWVVTHTATLSALFQPGRRIELLGKLQDLALSLYHDRDPDHWQRFEGLLVKKSIYASTNCSNHDSKQAQRLSTPTPDIDDLLTLILMTIVTSAGDFKHDAACWFDKAIRLSKSLGLNRLDSCTCVGGLSKCNSTICAHSEVPPNEASLQEVERKEEARRVFWLLFALDRHLALSWNANIAITDDQCLVFSPLPETVWLDLDKWRLSELPARHYGPMTTIDGLGFFEYFLPLMTVLGDVISTHHRTHHPRLGQLDNGPSEIMIETLLERCATSLDKFEQRSNSWSDNPMLSPGCVEYNEVPTVPHALQGLNNRDSPRGRRHSLVVLYSRFIIHVLYVLLHGKWDAISLLTPDANVQDFHHHGTMPLNHPQQSAVGEWITSPRFGICASHAISASETVADILAADPELNFMPYLFGIYLLHGSFILLLFADRLPNIGDGRNESVERACETIIRAHEVSVVTLPTEFQKRFRRVLRATLYSVRQNNRYTNSTPTAARSKRTQETDKARQELFDLYRWTNGSCGLVASCMTFNQSSQQSLSST